MPKTKNKETIIKRVPRPLGLTLRMQSIQGNKEEQERVKITLIEQWASNNMIMNGELLTVEEMGMYLNMESNIVMKYMWKAMSKVGKILDKKNVGEIARVIFSTALKKTVEIQSLMAHQATILLASQGGEYKPFISATVNQALQNLNSTQAPILALLKVITDKQESPILYTPAGQQNDTHVTSEFVLKAIQDSGEMDASNKLENDPNLIQRAVAFAGNQDIPDTNPNTQQTAVYMQPKLLKGALNPGNQLTMEPALRPTSRANEERYKSHREIEIIEEEEDFQM